MDRIRPHRALPRKVASNAEMPDVGSAPPERGPQEVACPRVKTREGYTGGWLPATAGVRVAAGARREARISVVMYAATTATMIKGAVARLD